MKIIFMYCLNLLSSFWSLCHKVFQKKESHPFGWLLRGVFCGLFFGGGLILPEDRLEEHGGLPRQQRGEEEQRQQRQTQREPDGGGAAQRDSIGRRGVAERETHGVSVERFEIQRKA